MYWKGQRGDVKRTISGCGICRRFDERSCRPSLGKSLFRCRIGTQPFQHVSLDPLDSFLVAMFLLSYVVKSMLGAKAENVYIRLQRLQFRFGTEVIQADTDKGSQLGKILGKKN